MPTPRDLPETVFIFEIKKKKLKLGFPIGHLTMKTFLMIASAWLFTESPTQRQLGIPRGRAHAVVTGGVGEFLCLPPGFRCCWVPFVGRAFLLGGLVISSGHRAYTRSSRTEELMEPPVHPGAMRTMICAL